MSLVEGSRIQIFKLDLFNVASVSKNFPLLSS